MNTRMTQVDFWLETIIVTKNTKSSQYREILVWVNTLTSNKNNAWRKIQPQQLAHSSVSHYDVDISTAPSRSTSGCRRWSHITASDRLGTWRPVWSFADHSYCWRHCCCWLRTSQWPWVARIPADNFSVSPATHTRLWGQCVNKHNIIISNIF